MAGDPLVWSIYEIRTQPNGDRRMAPLRSTDVWTCPKCRHMFRRELRMGPRRWQGYAVTGRVRRDLACESCRARIDALTPAEERERLAARRPAGEVGVRIPGVDAG